jgi:hypothetical protein
VTVALEANARELSQRELEDEIATLAAHIYAGTCRWLELIAELDRRGDWGGTWTTAEWLAWRCALGPRAAREHVRVARALDDLPEIREAFSRGRLSYAKVRALTRVANTENEKELLLLAFSLTASELDRAVACYRRVAAAEAKRLHELAYFDYFQDADGMLYFKGRLAPEDGALFLRALEAGRDAVREREQEWDEERYERIERGPAGPHEPRYRPTNADALVAMADAALSARTPHSSSERYQVVVHVEPGAPPSIEDGPSVATETAERIACDASLVRMTELDREPLSIGRKARVAPAPMRRALGSRDRGCRFPGCQNRRFVDAPPPPSLVERRGDEARQPRAALPPPSSPRARGRLRRCTNPARRAPLPLPARHPDLVRPTGATGLAGGPPKRRHRALDLRAGRSRRERLRIHRGRALPGDQAALAPRRCISAPASGPM